MWKINDIYIDRWGWTQSDDQFLRWLYNGNNTIPNAGGIRWQNFLTIRPQEPDAKQNIPPYVVLMTAETATQFHNPWSDIVPL